MVLSHLWTHPVYCFFCNQEAAPRPRDARNFKCTSCDCWNRYDASGEIVNDEQAMYEESLNAASFSKRASPRKDALPTVLRPSPSTHRSSSMTSPTASDRPQLFCRTCTTNQSLQLALLANYLPEESDPAYPALLAQLPAYKKSLEVRYPLVCSECEGNVREEMDRSERLGRRSALGSWLEKKPGGHGGERRRNDHEMSSVWIWRGRGCLWVASLVATISSLAQALSSTPYSTPIPEIPVAFLPPLALISIMWNFWDPLWKPLSTGGRGGRPIWLRCQSLPYIARVMSACHLVLAGRPPAWWLNCHLGVEITILVLSLVTLSPLVTRPKPSSSIRITRNSRSRSRELTPYPVTVIPTSSTSTSTHPPSAMPGLNSRTNSGLAPTPQPDDIFSTLSLSAHPHPSLTQSTSKIVNPVFGQTSLLGSAPAPAESPRAADESEMDWEGPGGAAGNNGTGANARRRGAEFYEWMQPQRFFPPSEPTGLEDLFQGASIATALDSSNSGGRGSGIPSVSVQKGGARRKRRADALVTFGVALLVAILAACALLLKAGGWSWSVGSRWTGYYTPGPSNSGLLTLHEQWSAQGPSPELATASDS